MKAEFKNPCLEIGSLGRLCLNGEFWAEQGLTVRVEGLIGSIFEFGAEVIRASEFISAFPETAELIPNARLQGVYTVNFIIPRAIQIITKKAVAILDTKFKDNLVKGGVVIGDAVFTETADYNEFWRLKLLELALKHKIGLPAGLAKARVVKNTLIFYAPNGDKVLKLTDRGYELFYRVFTGIFSDNASVLYWLIGVLLKKFQEEVNKFQRKNNLLIFEAEGFKITYNADKAKLENLEISLKNIKIKNDEQGIVIAGDNVYVVVPIETKRFNAFRSSVGSKLWEICKYLVF